METLFCQISNQLINPSKGDKMTEYYDSVYDKHEIDGYYKGEDFWEVPLWIAEASGFLKGEKELHVVRNLKESVSYIEQSDADYVLFSVLDVNKAFIKQIIRRSSKHFILGGYALEDSLDLSNVTMLDSMPELAEFLDIPYEYKLDFSLFKGFRTIPRLTLSTGCFYRCKFCTVPNRVKEVDLESIKKQALSFFPLKFQLIYLNDKTFGQASNYRYIKELFDTIKDYNPSFEGFIVQTTCDRINKGLFEELRELNVKVVELGVETYNDRLLKGLKKPQNTKTINKAMDSLIPTGVKIVPNFIVGIKGETDKTYRNTLRFIQRYRDYIYSMNIYNLALYEEAELNIKGKKEDKNENNVEKSFHTQEEKENAFWFSEKIFTKGIRMLNYNTELINL